MINTGEHLLGALFDPLIDHLLDLTWAGQYIDAQNHSTIASEGAYRYFHISAYHHAF